MGELSLDGTLQPVKGVLPIALKAKEEGFRGVVVPAKNAREAAVVEGLDVYGMENLGDVVDFFNGTRKFTPVVVNLAEIFASEANKYDIDFSDVRGLENVKRALEVAAAGGHYIILYVSITGNSLAMHQTLHITYLAKPVSASQQISGQVQAVFNVKVNTSTKSDTGFFLSITLLFPFSEAVFVIQFPFSNRNRSVSA